eukprot:TRINITY_DN758_c0_g1_i1.p1 TRINITY_DN758_c0_g1~~TRINITY_DN758_c0_g1_i1.p1  ORF type:complete len:698 (-),score=174.02 TRINITY_DN758_c0_g1_i1:15-2108(-)
MKNCRVARSTVTRTVHGTSGVVGGASRVAFGTTAIRTPVVRLSLARHTPVFTGTVVTSSVRPTRFAYRSYAAYPPHNTLGLPALSPTMSHGNLASWGKKEGDKVSPGDMIAEVDTDKATMAWESTDEGYIAKILIPRGTSEVKVGTPAVVIVEDEADIPKFKDYKPEGGASADDASSKSGEKKKTEEPAKEDAKKDQKKDVKEDPKKEPKQDSKEPKKESKETSNKASKKAAKVAAKPKKPAADLPAHNKLGLPALSPTMETGKLSKWNKKVGDKVSMGDALALIETDKASVDWESVDEGYVAKLLIEQGADGVAINTPALILVEDEGDIAAFKDYVADEPADASADESADEPADEAADEPEDEPVEESESQKKESKPSSSKTTASSSDRPVASPYARKLAGEKGIDLSALSGTGPNNRIIAADVLEYKAPVADEKASSASASAPAQKVAPAKASAQPTAGSGNYTDIPNSNIRKVIARRLTESKQTIPHYYLTVECRVDKLMKLREEFNNKSEGKYKLSLNDFIIKASALALKTNPSVNSSWADDAIRRYHNIDINVAVNTPDGLFTPYVTDVDRKGLIAISQSVKDLANKAKDKKLTPKDYEGGTFTISNLGMFGISQFAAVINPPQAAILAVGSTTKRLETNRDVLTSKLRPYEEASYLTVTLSCDHRVVDGAVGAEWLQSFKSYMEDPFKMLL